MGKQTELQQAQDTHSRKVRKLRREREVTCPGWRGLQPLAASTVKVQTALSANALGPSDSCGQLGCPKPVSF